MGLKKAGSTTAPIDAPVSAAPAPVAAAPAAENGTAAAVIRLQKKAEAAPAAAKFQGRDFDKEARGKTRCVQFEAALMSPAIAGMRFETMAEYLALCKEAADFGTKYTFGD